MAFGPAGRESPRQRTPPVKGPKAGSHQWEKHTKFRGNWSNGFRAAKVKGIDGGAPRKERFSQIRKKSVESSIVGQVLAPGTRARPIRGTESVPGRRIAYIGISIERFSEHLRLEQKSSAIPSVFESVETSSPKVSKCFVATPRGGSNASGIWFQKESEYSRVHDELGP